MRPLADFMSAEHVITFAKDIPEFLVVAENILHLKGFGGPKLMTDWFDDEILLDLHNHFGDGGVVVWDGDSYHEHSFTRVLDKFLSTSKTRAVAFLHNGMGNEFHSAWRNRVHKHTDGIHVVVLDDPHECAVGSNEAYVKLGIEALRLTQAMHVWCIGGGGVAADELSNSAESHTMREGRLVQWRIYRVPRMTDPNEYGSLYARALEKKWSNVELRIPSMLEDS